MLALNDIDLKQTRFYKDVFEEGRQAGIQQIIQNEEQIAFQQGRVKMLIMILRSKFGRLSKDQKNKISHFEQEDFIRVLKKVWYCESLQAVFSNEEQMFSDL